MHRLVRILTCILVVDADHIMFISFIGIGRATAVALSKAGWSLALFARRLDKLNDTRDMCADHSKTLVIEGSVSDEGDVLRLFETTVNHFGMYTSSYIVNLWLKISTGRLDLLFNVRFAPIRIIPNT